MVFVLAGEQMGLSRLAGSFQSQSPTASGKKSSLLLPAAPSVSWGLLSFHPAPRFGSIVLVNGEVSH